MTEQYKIHPAAELFPMLEGEEFEAFKESIAEHGQIETIKVKDGLIIDGRNRLRACEALGIGASFEEVDPPDVIGFIVAMNLQRRHMGTQQRAAIAAELANLKVGDVKSQRVDGLHFCRPSMSTGQAADLMNVSERTVFKAKRRMREDPEEHERVKRGEKTKKVKKVQYSWRAVAHEEGLLGTMPSRGACDRLRKELSAANPDPELFEHTKQTELRETCKQLRMMRDPELVQASAEQAAEAKRGLKEKEESKLERAIRLAKRALEYENSLRFAKMLDDALAKYSKEYDRYREFNNAYGGVMTRIEYKNLLSYVHPDRAQDEVMKKRANVLFDLIKQKETLLCGLKPEQKSPPGFPTTFAELMARRKKKGW